MHGERTQTPVSISIVEKVARKKRVDPLELTPCLNEVIDPDALDDLFSNRTGDGSVTFEYADYEITVKSNGDVTLQRKVPIQN